MRVGSRLHIAPLMLAACPLGAQRLMTPNDLGSLAAGPPTARITYGPSPLQFGTFGCRTPRGRIRSSCSCMVAVGFRSSTSRTSESSSRRSPTAGSPCGASSIDASVTTGAGGRIPSQTSDSPPTTCDKWRRNTGWTSITSSPRGTRRAVRSHSGSPREARFQRRVSSTSKTRCACARCSRWAPAPDLEQVEQVQVCGGVIDRLMGGAPSAHADRYAAASAMRLAPVGVPQTLVIGAKDQAFGPGGRAYFARPQAIGDTSARIIKLSASGHFEMIDPGSTSWPAVYRALRALVATARK